MEFLIALLFVSGPLRGVAEFLTIPIVHPAVFSSLCIFFVLLHKIFLKNEIYISRYGVLLASVLTGFLGLVTATSLFTVSTEVFLFKSAISILPLFSALVFCFLSDFDIDKFFNWIIRLAIPICLIFLFYFPQWRLGLLDGKNYDFEFIRTLYLGVGGLAAFSSLIMLVHPNKLSLLSKLFLFLLFFVTLFISSARAPLVFLILCLLLAAFIFGIRAILKGYTGKWVVWAPTGLLVFAIAGFLVLGHVKGDMLSVIEMSVDRMLLLISSEKGASFNTRLDYLTSAFKYIEQAPLMGSGVGSYGRLALKEEIFMHPHNIFLESWFELGLAGVVLVLFLFGFSLYAGFQSGVYAVFLCLGFVWLNAMKSFSFAENRQLFVIVGLALYVFQSQRTATVSRENAVKLE